MSPRNCSSWPLFTPKLLMKAASASGSCCSETCTALRWPLADLPACDGTRQSAGNVTSTVFSSPAAMPTSASSTSLNMPPEPLTLTPRSTPPAGTRSSPARGDAGPRSPHGRARAAGADDGHAALDALGRPALVARLRPGLDLDRVAGLRRTRDHAPAATLLAQVLDHAVDVPFGHLRGVAHDAQRRDVDLAEVRHHFEGGDVGQFALGGLLAGFDLRLAGQAQLVAAHGLVEALRSEERRVGNG